jgi:hypothetical protein
MRYGVIKAYALVHFTVMSTAPTPRCRLCGCRSLLLEHSTATCVCGHLPSDHPTLPMRTCDDGRPFTTVSLFTISRSQFFELCF